MRLLPIAFALLASSSIDALAQARDAVILDFGAPLTDVQRQALRREGFLVGPYLGDGRYQASIPAGESAAMSSRLSGVEPGASLSQPSAAVKLDPLLGGRDSLPPDSVDPDGKVTVLVTPAQGTDDRSVQEGLSEFGEATRRGRSGWILRITPEQVESLAGKPVVERLEAAPRFPTLR